MIFLFEKKKRSNIALDGLNIEIFDNIIKVSHTKKHVLFLYVIYAYYTFILDDKAMFGFANDKINSFKFDESFIETILKEDISTVYISSQGQETIGTLNIIVDNQKKLDKIFL